MRSVKIRLAAAASAVCVLCMGLSGCGFGMSVENLLSPPILSEEQESVYEALKKGTEDDITLVYPRTGSYRSAYVFNDLDGDGGNEAVVFYERNNDDKGSVRVNILDTDENGQWRSVYDHAGAGTSIDQVFFTDLGGTGRVRMAIGYGYITPTEKTLKVYSFNNGILETEYSESYYKTVCMDMDRDGGEDIAVINCNNENHGASVSLVTDEGEGAVRTSYVRLSENTADMPSVVGGMIGSSTPALFIDGLLGSGRLSTEIIYCMNGRLRNPAGLSGSDLAQRTTREKGLYCRDVDNDGIVEIPESEPFPGYREGGDAVYMTNWNVYENYSVVKKYSSLTEPELGFSFMLPVRWEGLVTVKNDSITGEKVFYKYNTGLSDSRLELMRILVCDSETAAEKSLEGYVAAAASDTRVYMVRFGDTEDNLLLTMAEVNNNFYLY